MKLRIDSPLTPPGKALFQQQRIPCLAKILIAGPLFTIEFVDPQPKIVGVVEDWQLSDIYGRAHAIGGSKYCYYNSASVTLRQIDEKYYEIVALDFFQAIDGWRQVIIDGSLGPEMEEEPMD